METTSNENLLKLCSYLNEKDVGKPLVVRNGYLFSECQLSIGFELFVDENAITLKYPFRNESETVVNGINALLNNAVKAKQGNLNFKLRKHYTQPHVYYFYWDVDIKNKSMDEVSDVFAIIQDIIL